MKKLSVLVMFFVLCAGALFSQALIPMDPAVRYGQLENGLTYYIRHNSKPEQRANFYIVQNVGAILEEDNQNGLAHFLEHMAFNGTKNFPVKGILNYMETIGAQFGTNLNAYTSLDETVYMLRNIPTIRPSIVDSCILVLHDWSSFISLEGNEIDKERGVIREEWRTGANANRRIWKESNKLKYPGSQYAKRDVIGDTAVINNFSYDALRAYYKKWYRPDLQALVIVGDINVDQIENDIKKFFGDIPKPLNPAKRIVYQIQDNKEPIVSIVTDPEARTSMLSLEYKHPTETDAFKKTVDSYNKALINSLISVMFEGRFSEITNNPDASFVEGTAEYSNLVRSRDAFQVYVIPKEGKEKQAFTDMLSEVERVKRYGFTQSELDRAKAQMLALYEKMYNERDKQKSDGYIREYVSNFLELEPIPGIVWEFEQAKKILKTESSLDLVNKQVQSYITSDNLVVDISGPTKKEVALPSKEEVLSALTSSVTMNIMPYKEKLKQKPLLQKHLKSGKIEKETVNNSLGTTEWTLKNGIKVILKPTKLKDDEVLFSAFSDGGVSLISNIDDLLSAQFAAGIVDNNGIGDFSAIDLEKNLAGKIASLTPSISGYSEGLSGYSSVKDVETLFQLNYLYFTAPRKDNQSYQALINQLKTALANKQKDPRNAFRDSISVWSSNHNPRTILLNLNAVDKIDQKKALKIYKERFANPGDFTFVLVGNINPDSIKPMILKYLGSLKTDNRKENWRDNGVRYPQGKSACQFDRQMEVQKSSVYIMFSGGMPYNLSNKVNISALADILDIRYTESVREDEGGTYGVSVRGNVTNQPQEQATLAIQFDTDPLKQEKLKKIIYAELDSIEMNGPKDIDLQKVKLNLLKQYKENKEENSWWLGAITTYEKDGINLATEYENAVNSLTKESIRQAWKALKIQGNTLEIIMSGKK
jgi:zinc protease